MSTTRPLDWRSAPLIAREERAARCRLAAAQKGVSGNCTFTRATSVKPTWDSVKKSASKRSTGISVLTLDLPDDTVISTNTDTQISTWKFAGAVKCLRHSNIVNIGGDQYFLVPISGLYTITAQLRWSITDPSNVTAASYITTDIQINGISSSKGTYHPSASSEGSSIVTTSTQLAAGDKVRIFATHNISALSVVNVVHLSSSWLIQLYK